MRERIFSILCLKQLMQYRFSVPLRLFQFYNVASKSDQFCSFHWLKILLGTLWIGIVSSKKTSADIYDFSIESFCSIGIIVAPIKNISNENNNCLCRVALKCFGDGLNSNIFLAGHYKRSEHIRTEHFPIKLKKLSTICFHARVTFSWKSWHIDRTSRKLKLFIRALT